MLATSRAYGQWTGRALLPVLMSLCVADLSAGAQQDGMGVRLIVVANEAEATDLSARLAAGESFVLLARQRSLDPSASDGGYLGHFDAADLRAEFQSALAGLAPGEVGPVTSLGTNWALLQRISLDEEDWIVQRDAGLQAFGQGDVSGARPYFEAALELAETLVPTDYRLVESLNYVGTTLERVGALEQAEQQFLRALEVAESISETPDTYLVGALRSLGSLYRSRSQLDQAEPLYRRALETLEVLLGPEHTDVAVGAVDLAVILFNREDYVDAESLYRRALRIRESALGPDHIDLAEILNNLATLLHLQEDYPEAAQLYQRALGILEPALGPFHPNVSVTLGNLARLLEAEERFAEAAQFYQRALASTWRVPPADEEHMIDVLEGLTDVIRHARFRDAELEAVEARFHEVLGRGTLEHDLLIAMSYLFQNSGLPAPGEIPLQRAIELYPGSRWARLELAQLYDSMSKATEALEMFQLASTMPGPRGLDSATDRAEVSFLLTRIGILQINLIEFDEALESLERALQVDPGNWEALSWIGAIHVRRNETDDALAAYEGALALAPEFVRAHVGRAEAHRMAGAFGESVAAADRALEIDPNDDRARYLRAMGLIRMGEAERGQEELQSYRVREAEIQATAVDSRDELAMSQAASTELVEGRPGEAIRLLEASVVARPESARLRFDLGMAQSRSGMHREAAATLQSTVELGLASDFIIHRSLALEHLELDNPGGSERHRALFLQDMDAALRTATN
jgi:tetratricopeptide (TPR) repeat protein